MLAIETIVNAIQCILIIAILCLVMMEIAASVQTAKASSAHEPCSHFRANETIVHAALGAVVLLAPCGTLDIIVHGIHGCL